MEIDQRQLGSWCSGITSALHAEGLGFKPRQVQSSWRKFLDRVGESILFEVDINLSLIHI